jgi:two-component system response regulator FlrC
MARVLIIGALDAELGLAARLAAARGARLTQAEGVASGMVRLRTEGADLVLCDVTYDIGWLVEQLAAERIACPVIACGRNADAAAAVRAIRAGAKEFLPLPPDAELIAAMLQAAAGEADAPVHRDPAMAALLERATQLATAQASVLITGESGTGKEVLARHIHRNSRRAHGPFVALNCAALPEALLESELFGHEKGAFSGAVAARKGKFEQADGGTLLLDEIGEMDPRLQAKILRVIQDIPPLRDRPQDILALAAYFAGRFATANGLPRRHLTSAAEALLLAHPWPGNVRELENALHRAVLLAHGNSIDPDAIELIMLPPRMLPAAEPASTGPAMAATRTVAGLVGRKVEEVERDLILETLTHCLGNRTRAAEILGISIRTLRNKLHEYRAQGMAVPAVHPLTFPGAPWPAEA